MQNKRNPTIEELISHYLDGTLSDEGAQILSRALKADDAVMKRFAAMTSLDYVCQEAAGNEIQVELIRGQQLPADPRDGRDHAGDLLSELAQMEAEAAQSISLVDVTENVQRQELAQLKLAKEQARQRKLADRRGDHSAGSPRIIIIPQAAFYGGIAAALLIAAILFITLTPEKNNDSDLAVEPPDEPSPRTELIVATVTDAVGAQWRMNDRDVDMPIGARLEPLQRVTLTHGFAEITTSRGAKALLQAPATFETTYEGNTLRLHQGRLVGKCLTDESKGFTVFAPGVDVVDLGTEFGVEADATSGTTILVMDGSVRAEPMADSPNAFEPVVLEKSQARRVVPESGELEQIAVAEAPAFIREKPHPYVAAVLDASPVVYWRFEANQGRAIANEIQPGRNDLKMVGSATLTRSGLLGRAGLLTNRVEPFGYFDTASPIDLLNGLEQGTIEFWYYADMHHKKQDERTSAMLLSLHDTGHVLDEPGSTSTEMLALELTDNSWLFDDVRTPPIGWREHSLRVYPAFFVEGDQRREIYTDHAHPIQQWQHVVLVKQQDTITLYLDGEAVEELPHTFSPIDPVSIRLGHTFIFNTNTPRDASDDAHTAPPRPLMGRLDEVALYDKPLTAEQVARHHALATGQETP